MRTEGDAVFATDTIRVQAGFRVASTELLAGGAIELEFFVENLGLVPLRMAVRGDRFAWRPAGFFFAAAFNGVPLDDPAAGAPNLGGPVGTVEVTSANPWSQLILLNDFVRLEDTRALLASHSNGLLNLECSWELSLAETDVAAMIPEGAPTIAVELQLELRRDDRTLAALIARYLDEVTQGSTLAREPSLARLLSLRSTAWDAIESLARHPDQGIAERARRALWLSRRG